MVAVVQLVEHQVVILGVAGSSPVSHPKVFNWHIVDTMRQTKVDKNAAIIPWNDSCVLVYYPRATKHFRSPNSNRWASVG